ncbi:MAG: hypothetical protein JXA10_08795 [Anaerolineae bacterium]|nr:hypothetical protein [Anaerolineae bacterium]
MSDDLFNFDDNDLIPEWMQSDKDDAPGSPRDASASPDSPPAALPPASIGGAASGARAPWEQHPGSAPTPPAQSSASAPWQTSPGAAPARPTAPATRPPWGESASPPSAAMPAFISDPQPQTAAEHDAARDSDPGLAWLADVDTGEDAADDAGFGTFDWDVDAVADLPGDESELPKGLTGALPWHDGASDSASERGGGLADRAGLSSDSFADAGLFDDIVDDVFGAEPPAAEPAEPPPSGSLRDRLLALSPDRAEPAPPDQDDDMDWFEAPLDAQDEFPTEHPPAEEPAASSSGIRALPGRPASSEPTDAADLSALFDEDGDDLAAMFDEEFAALEDQADKPASDTFAFDFDTAPPAVQSKVPASPGRGIRRIAPSEPVEPPEPEPEETLDDLDSWLTDAEWDDAALPASSDLTYEEWERINEEREHEAARSAEDRLLDEVPELLQGVDPSAAPSPSPAEAAPPDTGQLAQGAEFVPEWFLGLDEQAAEDVPDWFQGADLTADFAAPMAEPATPEPADSAADSSVPDWFKAPEALDTDGADWAVAFGAPPTPHEPEPEFEPEPEPEPEFEPEPEPEPEFDLDLASEFELGAEFEPAAEEPLIEPASALSDMDDELSWMAAPDATPDEADELPLPQTDMLFADFLADTEFESAPEPEIEPAPASMADADEWFAAETDTGLDDFALPSTDILAGRDEVPEADQPVDDVPSPAAFALDDFALPGTDELLADFEAADSLDQPAGVVDDFALPSTDDLVRELGDFEPDDALFGDETLEPGEVPDWLAQAGPVAASDSAEPTDFLDFSDSADDALFGEPPSMDDFALPLDFDDEFALPDDDARADPLDISFPEIGLDDTMPSETAVGDMIAAEDGAETAEYEDWMRDFAPKEADTGLFSPAPTDTSPLDDFVERFDPALDFAEEVEFDPARASVQLDDDSPAWLREMADDGAGVLAVPDDRDLFGAAESGEADLFGSVDEMDWLSGLSADSLLADDAASADAEQADREEAIKDAAADWAADWPADDLVRPADDRPFANLEAEIQHTGPLDSNALADLLGWNTEESAEAATSEPADALSFDLDAAGDDFGELDDLAALFDAATLDVPEPVAEEALSESVAEEDVSDLGALFGEGEDDAAGALDAVFGEDVEPDAPIPAIPVSAAEESAEPRRGLFRRGPQAEEEPPPAAEAAEPAESATPAEPESLAVADRPEWLDEMRPSDLPIAVRAGGIERNIRQKQLIELPERLRVFYERTMSELVEPEPVPPAESGPLMGIPGALPVSEYMLPTELVARPTTNLVVTPEQQLRIAQLQALLAMAEAEEEEALESDTGRHVTETFSFDDLGEGDDASAAAQVVPTRARRARQLKPDRIVIGVVLFVALIVPFLTDALHFAAEPAAFSGDQLAAVEMVNVAVQAGDYVLFAFEYGPTAAGELDPLAEAVMRDVLSRGAIALTISTDPAGAFHTAAVIAPLLDDPALLVARGQNEEALVANEDYVLLRYLSGEAVGVRSLTRARYNADGDLQLHPAFGTDLRGDETHLGVGDIAQDLALIVVIGEESGAVRTWAEQLQGVPVPKIALVTAAIEPLTAPYVHDTGNADDMSGYVGYLAGVRDTYRYNASRNIANRTPYEVPADAPLDVPDPTESRWHSMALGAAVAAGLIMVGMVVNVFRGLTRRRRR